MSINTIRDSAKNVLSHIPESGIRACYVIGSYADDTAVSGSDLDLVLVVKSPAEESYQSIESALKHLAQHLSLDLDYEIVADTEIDKLANPSFKLGSDLLFGDDIRDAIPMMTIEAWARDRLHTSYWRMMRFFNRPHQVNLPLTYPNADDPFWGYVIDGKTRQLLRHITWTATALIAHQGGQFVARKSDVHRVYRASIGGQFANYIEALYTRCKLEWQYHIPAEPNLLIDLCRQTLSFEQHFISIYQQFILEELTSPDQTVQAHARWIMSQYPLMVPVITELMTLSQ